MKPESEGPVRVACVGASITFGLGLPNRRAECYPTVLQSLLGDRFRVRNFGYSGATAGRDTNEPYWRTPSFTSATRFDPHLAILAFGTNDAQHANLPNLERFDRDLADLVEHFRSQPSCSTVLLATPLPVFEPMPEIDTRTLDTVIRPNVLQVAASLCLPVIDAYSPFLGKADWLADNLHPNADGARLMAGLVHTALHDKDLIT